MIVSTDIQTILYKKALELGVTGVYKEDDTPTGKLEEERVTVHSNSSEPGITWKVGFVHVNIAVPDLDEEGTPDLDRMNKLERMSMEVFKDTSVFDGTPYTYEVDTTSIEVNRDLKCHYVNVRVLFKVLNVIVL